MSRAEIRLCIGASWQALSDSIFFGLMHADNQD
jgi:hypothetical protein